MLIANLCALVFSLQKEPLRQPILKVKICSFLNRVNRAPLRIEQDRRSRYLTSLPLCISPRIGIVMFTECQNQELKEHHFPYRELLLLNMRCL